jgi:hypothetical protein
MERRAFAVDEYLYLKVKVGDGSGFPTCQLAACAPPQHTKGVSAPMERAQPSELHRWPFVFGQE